jgi:ATP-dependent Lhr-like helicase
MSDDTRGQVLTRSAPISIALRSDLAALLSPTREIAPGFARWDAQAAHDSLARHGALFFDDLLAATGLLPAQLEEALRELAAIGLATSDGFAAVRALDKHAKHATVRRGIRSKQLRRRAAYSQGGRWSLFPPFAAPIDQLQRAERWARLLLARYGVMFRDLLARESLSPPWHELVRIYRRLEMRGEIRGGRFVAGVAGEQYALPDAVDRLRQLRDAPRADHWQVISAADPLNLVGVITRDARVPATRCNRIAFCDGWPVASWEAGSIRWLRDLADQMRVEAARRLSGPIGQTSHAMPAASQPDEKSDDDWLSASTNDDASPVEAVKIKTPASPI